MAWVDKNIHIPLSDRQRTRFDENQQVKRVFSKTDQGAQAIAARDAALTELDKKYKATAAAEADWMSGAAKGYNNWLEEISNVSGTVSDGVKTTMDSAFTNVTSMLEGNKVSWKSWGVSVLQIIEKVALQMAVVSAMGGGSSSSSGLFGSLVGGVASYFGGSAASGAASSSSFSSGAYSNLSFNAKGGVYDSPSLNSFSGGVYNTPTMFAFAQGAGVFGEAGPEAIMPLTRAADGSLGVRAVGGGNSSGVSGGAPQVYISIDGNGNSSSKSSDGWEQFGTQISNYVKQLYQQEKTKDLRPGGDIWNAMKSR